MKKRNRVKITKNTSFLIYGAATTGAIFYDNLKKMELNVRGFIDERADEMESYKNLPVVKSADVGLLMKDDTIIVIAIKNVFEHSKIANQLRTCGAYRIIYKEYDTLNRSSNKEFLEVSMLYDAILGGENIVERSFPISERRREIQVEEYLPKRIDEGIIVAKIPVGFVFSDLVRDGKSKWEFICALGLYPHINLFESIKGPITRDINPYLEFCRDAANRSGGITMSKRWEESIIKNRIDVYHHMDMENQISEELSIIGAPSAVLQSENVFSLKSGKHRVVYQIVNGRHYVNLRVHEEEYEKWLNRDAVNSLCLMIKKKGLTELPVPIMNPVFYRYPSLCCSFYYSAQAQIIKKIFTVLYDKCWRTWKSLSVLAEGYFSMMILPICEKMGMKTYVKVKQSDDEELIHEIEKLYRINTEHVESIASEYDIIILEDGEKEKEKIKSKLFFELASADGRDTNPKYNYESLYSAVADGKRKEVRFYIMEE